jgi:SAM-dependent methyltransferase
MKNADQWQSQRWKWDARKNRYVPNLAKVYPGSIHIADIQIQAYYPVLREHITGRLLDCGCDKVPYYGMYKDITSEVVCTDWEVTREGNPFVDFYSDLNQPLEIETSSFDTVLLTDVLPHIRKPHDLFAEFFRILRPGGKAIVTCTFINWMGEPPHEFGHYSEYGLRAFAESAGLEVVQLDSYGGYPDVLIDTLNKGMTGRISNRFFRFFRAMAISTPWYRNSRRKTMRSYGIGYILVARKP